ncbi:MAG: DUF4838 domain-containing protein, partial [Planctomycetota bacterium]|nr:DUF4838 domain-containing protein [Planctomycetota bacterium]
MRGSTRGRSAHGRCSGLGVSEPGAGQEYLPHGSGRGCRRQGQKGHRASGSDESGDPFPGRPRGRPVYSAEQGWNVCSGTRPADRGCWNASALEAALRIRNRSHNPRQGLCSGEQFLWAVSGGLSYGGHSYYDAVPAKEYGKTKPEYFALIGGLRTPTGNHLCITNGAVQELMLREMEKRLDEAYQWVELAQTDGYRPCECTECAAVHPDPGERTWIVHRKLAEAMQKRRPGKKVMILAYPPNRNPPKSFDRFPDNVV